ncbi:MAG: hypothetical protein CMP67_04425 [Flavobacteriales bacterium]|nr:hypothetical protein [Flavobacteriales bacterium]|tara:strand:+ start:53946 stop:55910 length:1965 start_codon:yes stop_codon:yes gene_type:complete
MCGIFGASILNLKQKNIKNISRVLYDLSETRGKEASGIAVNKTSSIEVFKTDLPAKQFLKRPEFSKLIDFNSDNRGSFIGHTRLVTDGDSNDNDNNQPVINENLVGIHNGIIVNFEELWQKYYPNKKHSNLDSTIFFELLNNELNDNDLASSLKLIYDEIYGMTTVACFLGEHRKMVLSTNNGSLYYYNDENNVFIFASEYGIIKDAVKKLKLDSSKKIIHVNDGNAVLVDLENHNLTSWKLNSPSEIKLGKSEPISIQNIPFNEAQRRTLFDVSTTKVSKKLESDFNKSFNKILNIPRCKVCLLPRTMPSVTFNKEGVCSNCTNYSKKPLLGENALKNKMKELEKHNASNKVLVGLSGGRDSCITLDYVVNELGIKPIAFSYDWGVITDLARRNQSRMCGKLGVEHILVSADIKKKRANIRKNVSAWLKRPHLGLIPLFMAGDKQYFHHANRIRKLYDIPVTIMGENHYEKTQFKTGFLGVKQDEGGAMAYNVDVMNKLKMLGGYAKEYMLNPAYINSSLWDTASAFKSYYVNDHSFYVNLFDYIDWNEEKVNDTLINKYDWELATDTKSTWRIGDGTAAFYNYIYLMVAGFTEFDTFNSNLIRAGIITREEGLKKTIEENQPRYDTIKWYLDAINLDFEETLSIINNIPKRY